MCSLVSVIFYYLTTFKGKFLDFGADLSLLDTCPCAHPWRPSAWPPQFGSLVDT
jgi:hypothetical protein